MCLYIERKFAKYPLMPLGISKNWLDVVVTIVLVSHGMVFIPAEYYLPPYQQSAKEASSTRSGVLIIPLTISGAVGGALTGVNMYRTGRYRELIWFGAFMTAPGVGLFTLLAPDTPLVQIMIFQIIAGAGMGPLFLAPIIVIQAAVRHICVEINIGAIFDVFIDRCSSPMECSNFSDITKIDEPVGG